MNATSHQERFEKFLSHVSPNGNPLFAGALLKRAAERYAEAIALICDDEQITYAQLFARAAAVTRHLATQGIGEDDRIVLLYENSINFFVAYYGIWQTGALVTPLNTFLHPKEIASLITACDPKAIIVSPSLREKIPAEISVPIMSDEIITLPPDSTAQELFIPARDADKPAVLLYTSGTTGFPKGTLLTSRNILVNCAQGASQLLEIDDDGATNERIYGALPFFHSYPQNTCLWSAVMVGATVIIVPKIERRALLEAFKHKPTIVSGLPQLYGLFCLMRNIPVDSVKYFVCGGDVLTDKIRMGFELLYRRRLCNGYGLTETSPFVTVDLDDVAGPTNTIGKPMPGIDIEIRDEENRPMKQGDVGTLWLRGQNVMYGYYKADDATAELIKDGWLNTGDLAYLDDAGNIVLSGRNKDLIKHKGIKIYPHEIENVLTSHPLISMAAVIGVMDDTDEIPVAYVVTREMREGLEAELKELCSNNMAAYKVPRHIYVHTELPMTATGKIDKKALRAQREPV